MKHRSEPHFFLGRSTDITYILKDNKLIEVEFGYAYDRGERKIKKFIEDVLEVLGPGVCELFGTKQGYI